MATASESAEIARIQVNMSAEAGDSPGLLWVESLSQLYFHCQAVKVVSRAWVARTHFPERAQVIDIGCGRGRGCSVLPVGRRLIISRAST